MPALTSGRYHIKWTRLADIPVPLYHAYVAVQHHKIYVTGCESLVEDALHQVYVIVKPHHEEDIFVITRGRGGAEAEV